MTKDDDTNPGVEFFYKLSHKPEFQHDLLKARKQLGIPENGYMDPRTRQKLWIEHKQANLLPLLGIELQFKKKYKVPTPYYPFIDDYIFFGKPVNATKNKPVPALLSPTKELEAFYTSTDELFASLLIFPNATKTSLIQFIKKHWREIELMLNKNIHKAERTRKTIYKDRNQEIKALWRMPIPMLQKEAGSTTKERDLLVSKILVKRGRTNKELSGGYIRKVANQK